MKSKKGFLIFGLPIMVLVLFGIYVFYTYTTEIHAISEPKEEKTIVNIWTKDRHDLEFWMERIEAFNENNDQNIMVRYQVFSDNYTQAVENVIDTSTAPDMIAYTQQLLNRHINRFQDITGFMDETFRDNFSEVILDGVNVMNGRCYYIPTSATSSRLFYNKEVFRRAGIEGPPDTMEELVEDARIITEKLSDQGVYGFAVNFKNAESAINRSLMKQGNIQYGLKGGYNFKEGCFDYVRYESLISQWRELMSEDCAYPGCEALDIDPLRKLFAAGKIGMYMSYSHSEMGAYISQMNMDEEWGCVDLPTELGIRKGAQNYNMNNGFLFTKNNPNIDKVWYVYTQIFANIENLREYYEQGLGISILKHVTEGAAVNQVMKKHPKMYIQENEKVWPLTPIERYAGAIQVNGLNYYEVIKKLIFGEADIHETLVDLTGRYNLAYQYAMTEGRARIVRYRDFNPYYPLSEYAQEETH